MDVQQLSSPGYLLNLAHSSPVTPAEFLLSLPLAAVLAYICALTMIHTLPKGLTRTEQHEFIMHILFISSTVALILLIVGANLARAFVVVGILSIIRFRNNSKASNTFPYYLVAIGLGLSCGAQMYTLGIESTIFVCIITVFMNFFHAPEKSEADIVTTTKEEGSTAALDNQARSRDL